MPQISERELERVPLRVHRFLAGAAREHRAVPAHQVCSAFSLLGSLGEMLSVICVSCPIRCCDFADRINAVPPGASLNVTALAIGIPILAPVEIASCLAPRKRIPRSKRRVDA